MRKTWKIPILKSCYKTHTPTLYHSFPLQSTRKQKNVLKFLKIQITVHNTFAVLNLLKSLIQPRLCSLRRPLLEGCRSYSPHHTSHATNPKRTFTETGSHQGQLSTKAPLVGSFYWWVTRPPPLPVLYSGHWRSPPQELLPHFSRTINSFFIFQLHTHTPLKPTSSLPYSHFSQAHKEICSIFTLSFYAINRWQALQKAESKLAQTSRCLPRLSEQRFWVSL